MKGFLKNNDPWIRIAWACLVFGAFVTAYAYSNFEEKGASEKVEERLGRNIRRVESKVDALLLNEGLRPENYEPQD